MTGDGDPPGWPRRRRDPVSRVVRVVAVVLLGAGRALTRLGAARCPSKPSVGPRVCSPPSIPRLLMLCVLLVDCKYHDRLHPDYKYVCYSFRCIVGIYTPSHPGAGHGNRGPPTGRLASVRRSTCPFVTTQPEMLAFAAGDLQGTGSAVAAGNTAAATPTIGWFPQLLSAQATAIHEVFVNTLGT